LRVSENRVMRRMFGPKREAVAGVWKRLHNEELHNLCALPDIWMIKARTMTLTWHKCIRYFDWTTWRKETTSGPRRRWEGNI